MEHLKTARTKLGILQYELAKRSGISRTMIHHLENGKRNPTLVTFHALAKALELELAEFIQGVQESIDKQQDHDAAVG